MKGSSRWDPLPLSKEMAIYPGEKLKLIHVFQEGEKKLRCIEPLSVLVTI
jgi:hypothetical protein